MLCGAIDLGGTKIEARLFDAGLETLDTRRIPTPVSSFEAFIDGLVAQIDWLCARAGVPDLPVGIGLPGWIDPADNCAFASNIPVTGRDIGGALRARLGRDFVLGNDCMALAHSEAQGGAGAGFGTVLGLVLGTGMGAGISINGALPPRLNGIAVEIGHVGMPARALAAAGRTPLPLWPCGCGKTGCMERYVAGTGLAALAEHRLGRKLSGEALVAAAPTDPAAEAVLEEWAELVAEVLLTLQLIADPDCVVLGGGLSKMPDVTERLARAAEARRLGPIRAAEIRLARFGDSSGARGMALLAREAAGAARVPA